jgi:hypothetical protein
VDATKSKVDDIKLETANIALVKTETDKIAAVKAKTDNLPSDPASQAAVLTQIAGVKTDTGNIWNKVGTYPSSIPSSTEVAAWITAAHTTTDGLINAVTIKVDAIQSAVDEALGLVFKNSYRDQRVYDVDGRPTSERLRTYDGNDFPGGASNLLHTYTVTYTYFTGTDRVETIKITAG